MRNFTKRHKTTHYEQRTHHGGKQFSYKIQKLYVFGISTKSKPLNERDLNSNARFTAS